MSDVKQLTCIDCGIEKTASLLKRHDYGRKRVVEVFQSEDGLKFYNSRCTKCVTRRDRIRKGKTTRENSSFWRVAKAVRSEKIAEDHFKKLGFSVKRVDMHGPDLTCELSGLTWTVEVKTVTYLGKGQFRVGKVTKDRMRDDLIAFILPNDRVYIDSMENHLSKCTKWGTRTVTPIVREFGMKNDTHAALQTV